MVVSESQYQLIHEKFGTPCFVYNIDEVVGRINLLNELFEGLLHISYAMKSNPHSEFLKLFKGTIS